MENNKLPTITDQDAKKFHNAIHDYEIVDGNPLTIGHTLKDLPTKVISHGRIYDTEYVSVGVRATVGTTIDVTQRVNKTTLPRTTQNGFNGMNSQLNMSRCDGEVMTWAHANKNFPTWQECESSYENGIADGLNTPYTNNVMVPLEKGQEPAGSYAHFAHYQIKGKPAHYVCENLYPVDPDVVQDL